ncbi:MAG: hypothetical protein ABIN58_06205, partial [candidate division WOR-3 bacterium]
MTVLNNKSTLKNIKPKPQHLFLQRGAGDAPHTPISSKKKNPSKKDADVKAFIDHYHDTFVAKF